LKKKDPKASGAATKYLEVKVDDKEVVKN